MGHFKIHADTITCVGCSGGAPLFLFVSCLATLRFPSLACVFVLFNDGCLLCTGCAYASAYTTARLLTGCLLTADQRSPLSQLFNLMATMRFYGASARAHMNAR